MHESESEVHCQPLTMRGRVLTMLALKLKLSTYSECTLKRINIEHEGHEPSRPLQEVPKTDLKIERAKRERNCNSSY